jgi:hypothetical protein
VLKVSSSRPEESIRGASGPPLSADNGSRARIYSTRLGTPSRSGSAVSDHSSPDSALKINLIHGESVQSLYIPLEVCAAAAIPVTPVSRFITGNRYNDDRLTFYESFRINDGVYRGINLWRMANQLSGNPVIIEPVAFNDYTIEYAPEESNVFLIIPPNDFPDQLLLVSPDMTGANPDDPDDTHIFEYVFGVREINFLIAE